MILKRNAPKPSRYRLSLLLNCALCLVVFAAEGQRGTITGKLQSEKAQPISFANLVLLSLPDSTVSATALSDESGAFLMRTPLPGKYYLHVTAIGFAPQLLPPFDIPDSAASKDFGAIKMLLTAKTLQDVDIHSLRPTITQHPDKMVVTVAGTAMAAGNTAFDVLGRSPGVFVDHEGNIQLNGRAGVTVMIDGKQTYLSARDLRTMLESMSAENIKNIEIITNPSSKYEAEGLTGILNINLKKNTQRGINGSVFTGASYNGTHWGYSFGGNINHKTARFNSFLSIDRLRRVGGREATFTRIFLNPGGNTHFDQVAEGNFVAEGPPTFRLGTDYSFNDKHSIGGLISFNRNTANHDFLTQTYMGPEAGKPRLYIDADNISRNTFTNITSNIHYAIKLDTVGSQVTADLDYIKITNKGEANFLNYYDSLYNGNDREDFLYTRTPNKFDIYSARLDLTRMLSNNRKFETGLRMSQVKSDNDSRFYFNNGTLEPDPLRSNHFVYDEKIAAAYVNYNTNLAKNTLVQTGLRMEHTASTGNLLTTGQRTNREYTDFFPSLFLQQNVNKNYTLTGSYSRRINRPNYGNLNPFRAYRDPYTYWEGNPYLRPQYSHSFSLTQNYKKLYILTLNYQINKDFMAELPRLDVANATTIYYIGNVDGAYSLGATAIAPVKVMKKWDTQNTAVLSYNYNEIMVGQQLLINDQLYYSLQSAHTIQLPKNIRMEMSFLFQGPAAYGLYEIAPRSRVDIGFKKTVLKKKLDISVNATDIFKTQRIKFKTNINGNVNDFDQYFRSRVATLSLRYNFSRGQKVDVKRRNTVEEVNRTGG